MCLYYLYTNHPDPAAPTNEHRSFEGFPIERFACERDPNSVYPVKQALPPAFTHSTKVLIRMFNNYCMRYI